MQAESGPIRFANIKSDFFVAKMISRFVFNHSQFLRRNYMMKLLQYFTRLSRLDFSLGFRFFLGQCTYFWGQCISRCDLYVQVSHGYACVLLKFKSSMWGRGRGMLTEFLRFCFYLIPSNIATSISPAVNLLPLPTSFLFG